MAHWLPFAPDAKQTLPTTVNYRKALNIFPLPGEAKPGVDESHRRHFCHFFFIEFFRKNYYIKFAVKIIYLNYFLFFFFFGAK